MMMRERESIELGFEGVFMCFVCLCRRSWTEVEGGKDNGFSFPFPFSSSFSISSHSRSQSEDQVNGDNTKHPDTTSPSTNRRITCIDPTLTNPNNTTSIQSKPKPRSRFNCRKQSNMRLYWHAYGVQQYKCGPIHAAWYCSWHMADGGVSLFRVFCVSRYLETKMFFYLREESRAVGLFIPWWFVPYGVNVAIKG